MQETRAPYKLRRRLLGTGPAEIHQSGAHRVLMTEGMEMGGSRVQKARVSTAQAGRGDDGRIGSSAAAGRGRGVERGKNPRWAIPVSPWTIAARLRSRFTEFVWFAFKNPWTQKEGTRRGRSEIWRQCRRRRGRDEGDW